MAEITKEIVYGKKEAFEILKEIYLDCVGTKYEKKALKEVERFSSFLVLKQKDYDDLNTFLSIVVKRYNITSFHTLVYVIGFLYRICKESQENTFENSNTILRQMLTIMGVESEILVKNLDSKLDSIFGIVG